MSEMISIASGFQYSVNIEYDLYDDSKLRSFIPTRSALSLLKEVLASTLPSSTDRSRILIGAYGKGKSHIVLMILSVLMKKDLSLFEKMLPKLRENNKLYKIVQNYYESDNKILPIIISGSNTSLTQAFLLALQRTLKENELLDIMPDTNYRAAIYTINRWREDYPETYNKFKDSIDLPVADFIRALNDFDIEKYEQFERIYPSLTSGSTFNPFVGFDVVELYESATRSLKSKGYTGIYVVYDEFSKYLEANISDASVSDTKMLQDFAEKCNRSGNLQMHLMLISHKEISNYIDRLPKQKTDGWRGVSERFRHVHLNNNFSQTYEIIASVIQKDPFLWDTFQREHAKKFEGLFSDYANHPIFSDMSKSMIESALLGCYPLHPVSTFILPRLSERIAQNERTLFTFLSAEGRSTLSAFLAQQQEEFSVLTPDVIYDYFEPLLKKEVYSGQLLKIYTLTETILENISSGDLEKKIVKVISLIYILEQFEKLKPTRDEITRIFSISYPPEEIKAALENLIEKEFVIYSRQSNDYLQLKQTSGVDIHQRLQDQVERDHGTVTVKDTLNTSNFDNYMYPSRYNNKKKMVRFFSFVFIDDSEIVDDVNWDVKAEKATADGIIYAVIPHGRETISSLRQKIIKSSEGYDRFVFILPRRYEDIEEVVRKFKAAEKLREEAKGNPVLAMEYDVIWQDLREVISSFIASYSHPEEHKAFYIHNGKECAVARKAALTGMLSDICDRVYCDTPIINNEAINKIKPTNAAIMSRSKILAGLLRNELEHNLGLTGTGQEVSIMRSTLLRTNVLREDGDHVEIDLHPSDKAMEQLLSSITEFVQDAGRHGDRSFDKLYDHLLSPKYHIGLREGLIPIYIAAVFHEYKQQITIKDQFSQVPLNADTLLKISARPESYVLSYLNWDSAKENYIRSLSCIFEDYIIESERAVNSYEFVYTAMRRWYMSLPKYAREMCTFIDGSSIDSKYRKFVLNFKKNIGSREFLFEKLPADFGYSELSQNLINDIQGAKDFYDTLLGKTREALISETKMLFISSEQADYVEQVSLTSVITDWCDNLDATIYEQLFPDGTDRCLALFRVITNDEDTFIMRLAKAATGLRIEDWDDLTIARFRETVEDWKKTADEYQANNDGTNKEVSDSIEAVEAYQMSYVDSNGVRITKRFNHVEPSKRGKLLYNSITSQIASMGQAITEQEKRQILMDILREIS